ncbi:MAG: tetratricopeptide repeat protein [Planctomycetota bacterium]
MRSPAPTSSRARGEVWSRAAGATLLPLLPLLACHASPPAESAPPPPPPPVETGAPATGAPAGANAGAAGDEAGRDAAEEAIARIRAGEYEGARELLADLLVERHLARAEAALAGGSPEDALTALDQVLALAPRHPAGLFLAAGASLALAEKAMAGGRGGILVEGSLVDALGYFERAGETPAALLGASRAAHLLGRPAAALPLARRAMELLEGEEEPAGLSLVPERVLADAAFGAYVEARGRAAEPEETRGLFMETEDALSRLLGRAAEDPAVWGRLADLYVWEGMLDDARGVLERGLDRTPRDEGLLARLDDVANRAGGAAAAVSAFAAFNARHPEIALGVWHQALASFRVDVASVMAAFGEGYQPPPDPEELPRAIARTEELFRACRDLEPSYAEACRGYEVMCRDALGWVRYSEGRHDEAVAAFRSMDELVENGMTWELQGQLLSGVMGVHFCAKARGDAGELGAAGELYEGLARTQPEDANWANNAGFFLRDAAVEIEAAARRIGAAARGEVADEETLATLREEAGIDAALAGTPAEKDALRAAANARVAAARALMERSRDAYRRAAELAPTDVRIVNDAALVLVYYLQTDLDLAEELLLRCVAMGEEQLRDAELGADQRFEIANAWGDAHENLGVLYAVHRRDAQRAIPWFERAAEIGPAPRPNVTNIWLRGLRDEYDPAASTDLLGLGAWGRPCE